MGFRLFENLSVFDREQKLPPGGLWTPWEWNDRVPLEEYYTSDVATPLGDEFEKIKNIYMEQS